MNRKAVAAVLAAIVVATVPWFDFMIAVADRPIRISTIISHRGNGFGETENTVAAIEKAHEQGFPVEIDLRLSKTGTAHLMHDYTLDRTTDCTGAIGTKTDAQLAACGVNTLNDALATGATLELHPKILNSKMMDELKAAAATVTNKTRLLFFLFPGGGITAKEIKEAFADHVIMWAVNNYDEATQVWQWFDPDKDIYSVSMHKLWGNPRLVRWITSRTRKLGVWFTCDEKCRVKPNRWMVMGMPITHAEVDNPITFESTSPSPTMPELVYRASATGLLLALAAGFLLRGYIDSKPERQYAVLKNSFE
ncbi:MAG: hypothetical protein CL678_00625 [Bdellovibrionaceae bacterium]|nr:hypothetical protein [Pseudobdellovibrionaceae bacterium]|tara:strand:- start:484 stop:1407 length:924 start_codon:yes stop_codon:yes gene_type:complete